MDGFVDSNAGAAVASLVVEKNIYMNIYDYRVCVYDVSVCVYASYSHIHIQI